MPPKPTRDHATDHSGARAAMFVVRAAAAVVVLTGLSLGIVYMVVSWPWSGRPIVDLTPRRRSGSFGGPASPDGRGRRSGSFGGPARPNGRGETQAVRSPGAARGAEELRIAVATMVSAEATFSTYRRLVQRICGDIGRREIFLLSPSYADVRWDLEHGDLDVAFVCTGTYVHARRGGRIKLLVRPEFPDDRDYRCLLIVPTKSARESLDDLRGATVAYTDPESNTGCLVPSAVLARRGLDSAKFFKKHIFTGSHDKSIQAVALGLVDVAAVDSLIWISSVDEDPALAGKVKVIWRSPPFGAPPVVVPSTIDAELEGQLREAFMALHEDEEGREILSSIGIKRFVEARDEDYRTAISLLETLRRKRGEP